MANNLFNDNLPPVADYIKKYDLKAMKSFGQNFILDANILLKIARSSGSLEGLSVIEIGPGPGGLTRAILANGAKKVIAIEKDKRVSKVLDELKAYFEERLEIIDADALEVDYDKLLETISSKCAIISNLPYNIASPLLIKILLIKNFSNKVEFMNLMFQKEVADRITAQHSSKAYGRLSIITNLLSNTEARFDIDRSVFTPPPKITSSVVSFYPKQKPDLNISLFQDICKQAFNQRRKMVRSSLKKILHPDIKLSDLGIDDKLRAENLEIDDYVKICNAIDKKVKY